jgi:hypothetical protein
MIATLDLKLPLLNSNPKPVSDPETTLNLKKYVHAGKL